MDKLEFLDRLRMTLNGSVPARVVEENVNYYENYINSQVRMGYEESEVLRSLGDPRLIAKSIISANDSYHSNYNANGNREVYEEDYYVQERKRAEVRTGGIPKWLKILIVCLIIFGIINVVATLISALLPIFFPILLVYFLVKLFRDWLN